LCVLVLASGYITQNCISEDCLTLLLKSRTHKCK